MSGKKVIDVGYFNVDNRKNSIIENAPYQDNGFSQGLDRMEKLTNNIRGDILKKNSGSNVKVLDFKNKKK